MIVAHFFKRVIRKKTYLMCETSCSDGSTSPWKGPEVMFETAPGEEPGDWIDRCRQKVAAAHPDHVLGDTVVPHRQSGAQTFDVVLKKPPTPVKRLLKRIVGK